jgi:hypothetical protein
MDAPAPPPGRARIGRRVRCLCRGRGASDVAALHCGPVQLTEGRKTAGSHTVRVLASGIDSLYLSFRGRVPVGRLEALEALRDAAQRDGAPVPIALPGRDVVVRPHGWGHYRYWVHCSVFEVFVARGDKLPAAYVQLRSHYLHAVDVHEAVANAEAFVRGWIADGVEPPTVSRMDLYADFQGWLPVEDDYRRFVTRGRKSTAYVEPLQAHFDGSRFTGFRIGKQAMVARLYDKTLEIKSTNKDWVEEIWATADCNVTQPVWRLEFQIGRQVLAETDLRQADEVLEARSELWAYATTTWLSLRNQSANSQRYRWPVADEWRVLQQALLDCPCAPAVRRRIREHDELVLVRGSAGYLTSLAALHGHPSLDWALARLRQQVPLYLRGQDKDFADVVMEKRKQLV